MENQIKEYQELSYIVTFDDRVYPTPVPVKDLEKALNGTSRFINLWTELLNVSNIKRVESKKVGTVENAILQIQDPELREEVRNEIKKRKAEWKTTNIEVLRNILNRLSK